MFNDQCKEVMDVAEGKGEDSTVDKHVSWSSLGDYHAFYDTSFFEPGNNDSYTETLRIPTRHPRTSSDTAAIGFYL